MHTFGSKTIWYLYYSQESYIISFLHARPLWWFGNMFWIKLELHDMLITRILRLFGSLPLKRRALDVIIQKLLWTWYVHVIWFESSSWIFVTSKERYVLRVLVLLTMCSFLWPHLWHTWVHYVVVQDTLIENNRSHNRHLAYWYCTYLSLFLYIFSHLFHE